MQLNCDIDAPHINFLQYADDGTLFFNNITEMEEATKEVKTFGEHAATEHNLDKCEGLWLDISKCNQQDRKLFGIKWPTETIGYLGIYIYIEHDKDNVIRKIGMTILKI